jgi:hypothetical protein
VNRILLCALAAVVGLASAIVLPYVVIDFKNAPGTKITAADWAAWAQAIGSILAVGTAAWIAVYQQDKNKQLQDEQRERKHFAARAMLPAALSELHRHIDTCLDLLHTYRDEIDETGGRNTFESPQLSDSITKEIKDCIEFSDDGPRTRLAELLEYLQIQRSRISQMGAETPRIHMITTTYEINSRIVDTLDIYTRIDSLFPYARRTISGDPGQPTKANMLNAANIVHFVDDDDVIRIINGRYT